MGKGGHQLEGLKAAQAVTLGCLGSFQNHRDAAGKGEVA